MLGLLRRVADSVCTVKAPLIPSCHREVDSAFFYWAAVTPETESRKEVGYKTFCKVGDGHRRYPGAYSGEKTRGRGNLCM